MDCDAMVMGIRDMVTVLRAIQSRAQANMGSATENHKHDLFLFNDFIQLEILYLNNLLNRTSEE